MFGKDRTLLGMPEGHHGRKRSGTGAKLQAIFAVEGRFPQGAAYNIPPAFDRAGAQKQPVWNPVIGRSLQAQPALHFQPVRHQNLPVPAGPAVPCGDSAALVLRNNQSGHLRFSEGLQEQGSGFCALQG